MNTFYLAFLSGLTTGGFSCLAVQGGLLTSSIAQSANGEDSKEHGSRSQTVIVFLLAKLIGYTILGFLLGAIGQSIGFTPKILGILQIIAGLYMAATAGYLLDLHPMFRSVAIQPPTWIYRFAKRQSIGPMMLGFFTILMPCGVTQAMMASAVASGNPWVGAGILSAFILGTSPVFFFLGISLATVISHRIFRVIAAGIVLLFAFFSVNGGLGLTGSIYTAQNFFRAATTELSPTQVSGGKRAPLDMDGYQTVHISVSDSGYKASATEIRVNVPTRVYLDTNQTRGCARAFTVPDYGISKVLPETGEEVIEFTPTKTGRLAYSCSMGMYTGAFTVVP